jgi:hypothetical protein
MCVVMRRHDLMASYQYATPRDANRSTVALNQAFAGRSTGGTAIGPLHNCEHSSDDVRAATRATIRLRGGCRG